MFGHESLNVYQRSLEFIEWATPVLAELPAALSVTKQLDRASTSIPLNIAEGNGKFSPRDRARHRQTAHGSALECAPCLDVAVAKGRLKKAETLEGKSLFLEIVRMLLRLRDHLYCRMEKDPAECGVGGFRATEDLLRVESPGNVDGDCGGRGRERE